MAVLPKQKLIESVKILFQSDHNTKENSTRPRKASRKPNSGRRKKKHNSIVGITISELF